MSGDGQIAAAAGPLTILAGGGKLPMVVAAAAQRAGRSVKILGVLGEAEEAISAYPHEWVGWGELGRIRKLIEATGGRDLVMIGSVRRPDFKAMKIDLE